MKSKMHEFVPFTVSAGSITHNIGQSILPAGSIVHMIQSADLVKDLDSINRLFL